MYWLLMQWERLTIIYGNSEALRLFVSVLGGGGGGGYRLNFEILLFNNTFHFNKL